MTVNILIGDALARLAALPDSSVHSCVTSPPYYGLRDYGIAGQFGLEPSVEHYIDHLVGLFREVRRVMRPDGTLWLNLGDSYAGSWGARGRGPHTNAPRPDLEAKYGTAAPARNATRGYRGDHAADPKARRQVPDGKNPGAGIPTFQPNRAPQTGLKAKDLIMVPARVALALQADGWFLRSEVVWHKPNAMPESVRDRPTCAHEKIFLLSPSESYFYDAEAVKEPDVAGHKSGNGFARVDMKNVGYRLSYGGRGNPEHWHPGSGRNRRNVWTVKTSAYKGAHFATFPPDLIEPCILAGTSEHGTCAECGAPWERIVDRESWSSRPNSGAIRGSYPSLNRSVGAPQRGNMYAAAITTGWEPTCECGREAAIVPATVLDPFGGAGTTGLVAARHGRDAMLVELNPDYAALAAARIRGEGFDARTTRARGSRTDSRLARAA